MKDLKNRFSLNKRFFRPNLKEKHSFFTEQTLI